MFKKRTCSCQCIAEDFNYYSFFQLILSNLVFSVMISFVLFCYSLIIQPHITNGSTNGHVIIDITKDANAKDWPPIVLDINNITITKAQGKLLIPLRDERRIIFLSLLSHTGLLHISSLIAIPYSSESNIYIHYSPF